MYKRLGSLKLATLRYRCTQGNVIEIYTILTGTYYKKVKLQLELHQDNVTRAHNLKLVNSRCHYDLRKYSFLSENSIYMEELPAYVITDSTNCISIFKNRLDRGSELSLAIVANMMQVMDWSTRRQRICEYHILRNYFVQILRQKVRQVDQSATSLTESWFVSELLGYQYDRWVTGQLVNKPTRG